MVWPLKLQNEDLENSEVMRRFVFGEPPNFFDRFASIEVAMGPFEQALLAFKSSLSSALRVGNIPFQLAQSGVLDRRLNQLIIAERIRGRSRVESGELPEDGAEQEAIRIGREKLEQEIRDPLIVEIFANQTLEVLRHHLANEDFLCSAEELLRQVLVISWGAFEILVNDLLRLLLNARPSLVASFVETKPYRDLLNSRILWTALIDSDFDLSTSMGNFFNEFIKLDSLEKIRNAIRLSIADPALDVQFKDKRIWLLFQQRNLIVHRRGMIDTQYLAQTSEIATIGEALKLSSGYIEASLILVRDLGCSLLSAAANRLSQLS